MKLLNHSSILAVLAVSSSLYCPSIAFTPLSKTSNSNAVTVGSHSVSFKPVPSCGNAPSFNQRSRRRRIFQKDDAARSSCSTTALQMAAEDFDESKYTEAAWSLIGALTKVADYYQAENVEAPFLLDVMLNPMTHNAGDNAVAAKKVVEKVLSKAGTDVKALRSELEMYFTKQAKLNSESKNKVMGRTLQKVLDAARVGKSTLGVSYSRSVQHCIVPSLKFTYQHCLQFINFCRILLFLRKA